MTSATASATTDPSPTSARIDVLDVLRGIALCGMIIVHLNDYARGSMQGEPSGTVGALESVMGWFFDTRFYTMFAILFGVGFALQLRRADARGEPFAARYLRRLAALAVFGFIAEGIFGYNVLFAYAVWGVPLLFVRRWPVRRLVLLAVLCASSLPLYNLGRRAIVGAVRFDAQNKASTARFQAAQARIAPADTARDWRTVVAARLEWMPAFHRQWSIFPYGSFTLILLGLIAFRLGVFDHPEQHRRLIVALMIAGVVSWAIVWWILPMGGRPRPTPTDSVADVARIILLSNGFRLVRSEWLAFTYIGAILLLVSYSSAWLRRLGIFGWAGRMALTSYMTQVIVLDTLFTPHGLDLKVSPLLGPVYAIALFGALAALSRWWLARYRFGPLEWMWRSVTYWRWQPMRIEPPATQPLAIAA
jgi:uncharacterized protein